MDGLKIEQLQSLQSKDQAALLDTVDEIRRHGVNRYVSLPQLIVCGDQSSGKSSVLEAISGVQFPVNDGLCTRFTTEVILRRATKSLATVKLIPAKDAPPSHKDKLKLFEKSSINHAEIPDLISEAKTFMGLTGGSTFSRDVLQLEVSGPKLPHLTLVDLPGLIHHPNKEQTEEDVQIPKELVKKYMSQARSIVLAIVTAKNDTSNQVVLEMAKAADPQGNRTMGIITKPDCLIKDSPNESNFYALASNKETYFKLDWHILRNGDFNERKDSAFDRDAVEKDFFASTIWNNLPSHKRGVEALRTRLSHVLYQQIQKELPSLLKEIENELAACKTTLERLGSPRDTPGSRRQYLTEMAGRFHDLVRAGTDGNYQNSFFRPASLSFLGTVHMQKTRLRANVRKKEQSFLDKMHRHGHTYVILSDTAFVKPQKALPEFGSKGAQSIIGEKDFLREIQILLDNSKGRELPGTFTPLLVGDLFVRQSKNWKPFAIDFVEDVWNIVKQFLDDVLIHVADENVREALLEDIIDPAMDKILVNLKYKVTELHSPYARGSPATLNPRFVKELESRRSQQTENSTTQPSTVLEKTGTEGADTHACRELLHLMQAYYTVALDVFVDNVSCLAVENCLMNALEALLSPLTVSEMSDEELENIAFESPEVRELRSQTLEKQSSLQKSFELCRRQARKLASNRLNNEAQKTETLLKTEVTKSNILPTVSTVTPGKSEAIKPQQSGQGASVLGSGASSTRSQNTSQVFGSSLFSTPSSTLGLNTPQTPSQPLSQTPSSGASTQNAPQTSNPSSFAFRNNTPAFGPPPTNVSPLQKPVSGLFVIPQHGINDIQPFGSPPTRGGFGSAGGAQVQSNPANSTTTARASTLSTSTPTQSNQTSLFGTPQKEQIVEFPYFKDIPTSSQIVPDKTDGMEGYAKDEDSNSYIKDQIYKHISFGLSTAKFGSKDPCKYSAEEIRLKDYYVLGLPKKVPAK